MSCVCGCLCATGPGTGDGVTCVVSPGMKAAGWVSALHPCHARLDAATHLPAVAISSGSPSMKLATASCMERPLLSCTAKRFNPLSLVSERADN